MNIALYSRQPSADGIALIEEMIGYLRQSKVNIILHEAISDLVKKNVLTYCKGTFISKEDLVDQHTDFLFSIGGDGTFIDAANLMEDGNIPILGINTGRIGFLTNVNKQNYQMAFQLLQSGDYQLENRFLLHIDTPNSNIIQHHFALNDISIHPSGDSINAIHVWANGEKLNTYWGDGLIVATPTGSTAYSLSCGGPILVPSSDVIVLTPIASHSLTVRPIVLPANYELTLQIESRSHQFVLSMDAQRTTLEDTTILLISKEKFTIPTVRLSHTDFYSVIREKLLWGIDLRNISKI